MRVKVTMNKQAIRRLLQAQTIALQKTAEAVKTDVMAKNVMPFDVGTMQNESLHIDVSKCSIGTVSIVVDTPYARRLYYHPEYDFKTDNNPNAQGEWFKAWIDGQHKDFAKKAYAVFYRKESGL